MHVLKHFISSIIQILVAIAWTNLLQNIEIDKFIRIINGEMSGFKDWIQSSLYVFICLFCIIGVLFFLGLGIYHIVMVFYYTFIQDNRQIYVTVDENHYIKDSFVELNSGKIIPIKITKIVMNKPTEEKETTETGE